jgi:hypothetical protein
MADDNNNTQKNSNQMEAYKLLCSSYHAIDDFRSKLLGFLPIASGTGIFFLQEKIPWDKFTGNNCDLLEAKAKNIFTAGGSFGFLVTLGLFAFELYGIKKCCALIQAGKRMEESLKITNGQFTKRPQNIAGIINEPFASGVIYSAALAAWSFFELLFVVPNSQTNLLISVGIFLIGFAGTLGYDSHLRRRADSTGECDK